MMLKASRNYVIVRIDDDFEFYDFGMAVADMVDGHRSLSNTGTIIDIGEMHYEDSLHFDQEMPVGFLGHRQNYDLVGSSLLVDTPCEVKIGDKVLFKYTNRIENPNEPLGLSKEIPIHYDDLYLKFTDDGFYPLNGLVILEMCEDEPEFFAESRGEDFFRGKVVAEGCLVERYLDYPECRDFGKIGIGKEVVMKKHMAAKIEVGEHRLFKNKYTLRRIHRKSILSIVE
jgi:hypothetical protein